MMQPDQERPTMGDLMADLFAAFPLRSASEQDRRECKRQFRLYCNRLDDLPLDLVHAITVELIESATFCRVSARFVPAYERESLVESSAHQRSPLCASQRPNV